MLLLPLLGWLLPMPRVGGRNEVPNCWPIPR